LVIPGKLTVYFVSVSIRKVDAEVKNQAGKRLLSSWSVLREA